MKMLLALGLVCCLPTGLAAEDQAEASLGTVGILVIEDSAPLARDAQCVGAGERTECMSFNRAVLTARIQKVSVLHERGRWM
ncbi:MAG: hypothetical protein ABI789_08485 [Usitatibacter sp.]